MPFLACKTRLKFHSPVFCPILSLPLKSFPFLFNPFHLSAFIFLTSAHSYSFPWACPRHTSLPFHYVNSYLYPKAFSGTLVFFTSLSSLFILSPLSSLLNVLPPAVPRFLLSSVPSLLHLPRLLYSSFSSFSNILTSLTPCFVFLTFCYNNLSLKRPCNPLS